MEPLPFFAMVLFAFAMVWKGQRQHPNHAALLWSLGCAVFAFFGAGVLGFLHNLAPINYYTHGTQITAAHGHLAFFGAYAMVNLAMITYAMPPLLGRAPYNQWLNVISFWIMSTGVGVMSAALLFAGVLQTHLERVLGQEYMDVQQQLTLFYWIRLIGGVLTAAGLALFMIAILVPGRRRATAATSSSLPPNDVNRSGARPGRWTQGAENECQSLSRRPKPQSRSICRTARNARCSSTPSAIACRCC